MKNKLFAFVGIVAISIFYYSFVQAPTDEGVSYPQGYREWTHVKTAIIGPESPAVRFRGIHHIYANDKAMEGYISGNFADGSVIVFDLLESKRETGGDITEGGRKFIDVMIRDRARYDSTGGWGFEEFAGNSTTNRTIRNLSRQQCFNCHAKQKQNDFVFSEFRK
jgi:hypothetical protein